MGFINELLNFAENYFHAKWMYVYVHPVNKEKKYNHINSRDKTQQHYSSRSEVQNQMLFPKNQSSQLPYIIFSQLMKLSYKARFFHRLQ